MTQQKATVIPMTADHTRLLQEGGMDVFTALLDQAATAAQLSGRLGISRARTNYILGRLVADGLVMVEQERSDGERVERTYRAQVASFGLQADGQSAVAERLATARYITEHLHTGLLQSIAREQPNLCMYMVRARVPAQRVKEYMSRLTALQAEFDAETAPVGEPWYAMVLALHPVQGETEEGVSS